MQKREKERDREKERECVGAFVGGCGWVWVGVLGCVCARERGGQAEVEITR